MYNLQLKKLIKIWLLIASRAAQAQFLTKWGGVAFLFGKVVRFLLIFVFIYSIMSKTDSLADYNKEQVILFFLTFSLIDTLIQAVFRGVYQFRRLVVNGDFDFDLAKPLPSIFRPIFGWTDFVDIITLVPLTIYFISFIVKNGLVENIGQLFLFLLLLINSLFLAFCLHLLICGICVITTEIDHLVWIYRDISNMGRFPTDIYSKGIQSALTFGLPVVIIFTIPAKALLGLLTWHGLFFAIAVSIIFFIISLRFWRFAIRQYSSASS